VIASFGTSASGICRISGVLIVRATRGSSNKGSHVATTGRSQLCEMIDEASLLRLQT